MAQNFRWISPAIKCREHIVQLTASASVFIGQLSGLAEFP